MCWLAQAVTFTLPTGAKTEGAVLRNKPMKGAMLLKFSNMCCMFQCVSGIDVRKSQVSGYDEYALCLMISYIPKQHEKQNCLGCIISLLALFAFMYYVTFTYMHVY